MKRSRRSQRKGCFTLNKRSYLEDFRGFFISKNVCMFTFFSLACLYQDHTFFSQHVFLSARTRERFISSHQWLCLCFRLLVTKWQNPAHPRTDSLRREKNGGKGA